MKIKIFSSLAFTILLYTSTYCSDIYTNDMYGFKIEEPEGWIKAVKEDLQENLDKMEFSEKDLNEIIRGNNGSVLLSAYHKYDPRKTAGLIPTIQVNVRANMAKNFNQFKAGMTMSAEQFKQYFDDFKLIVTPKEISISGIRSIVFVCTYNLKMRNGGVMKVRSRTYGIPYGSYFFQVNFTDGQDKEDSSELFNKLVKTIVVGRSNN